MTDNDRVNLLEWYRAHRRPLPWRENRDPYRVWISEIMLQQTTVEAVIPYYQRFLSEFPTLKSLAEAPLPKVLELWAGLGYYTRARNLHQAARELARMRRFPETHTELLKLPGFGPYTARAVSSIAFGEKVGVLDGNVIRIVSRRLGEAFEWWKSADRAQLQGHVDRFAAGGPSHEINQAMMELGATICTPANPKCIYCPWLKSCEAHRADRIAELPLRRERRERETWLWSPQVIQSRDQKILFVKNTSGPFLRNELLLPGTFRRLKQKPREFDLRHSITHHDIFIEVRLAREPLAQSAKTSRIKHLDGTWLSPREVASQVPFSIVGKVLRYALSKSDLTSHDHFPRTHARARRVSERTARGRRKTGAAARR